ncbi:MAG: lipocalin family protein [Mucilaginibacter sp.]|nr:lipocalin family protein [Mucilaginibacter sp.]
MKKLPILILMILLFASCKKNQKPTPIIDPTGTWTLYSLDTDAPPYPIHSNVQQYPCMADNVLTFNKDLTYTINYTGKDTCFIGTSPYTFPAIKGPWIGMPGEAQISGGWRQDGNTVYWGPGQGTISTSNGKTFLTAHTSVTYNGVTYDYKTVTVKQ